MKKLVFILSSILFSFSSFSQELLREQRVHHNFSKIEASNGMNIFVTKGDTCSVELETNDYVLESLAIKSEVSENTLKLILDDRYNKQRFSKAVINIHITLPVIEYISAIHGSNIYVKDEFSSENLIINTHSSGKIYIENNLIVNNKINIDINGRGYFTATNITAKSVDLKASSGSEIIIEKILVEDKIECNANNKSLVVIDGQVTNAILLATSNSELKLKSLDIENANVVATTSSIIHVAAKKQLIATATNRAIIYYAGKPKTLNKEATSGGKITNRRIL